MRKAQKKDILDMIQTLHEAHEEIKNHIDRNNTVSAQDLLAQCQECAVSIGNAIETMEKEDCITIPYIQDYCDLVYQIYEALQNNTDSNANKIYKNLKKQLLRIENSVKNDIPVRKEVVFFPYKASMWDSLESVYLAAKEDPECDAYCVPIPYYDRNPDRSLGQMHYEGNEYPKNIEVIDWQSYNFEERKPDVIYIHNPYDDWNLVTCVHPRFFSSNLKKYTEKLVYIPYFVLQEIEPDDQIKIGGMKHLIWTPGVINADKVIVQSEKMKQIYVNEYLKAAQANGLQGNHLDRKYLEEKFLGLGSPKIDKVLNTKKEDLEIPEEWLKIIQKPDGSWKKIIFYNTSIAALLENNEKMLEKMEDVFRIFKENKDEVVLLWRPHPLIKSTVSSMRPQLWEIYEKIVKRYKEEGWGIYDDSADMDRAVVLSDGYYGDQSSIVQVYLKTKKPLLIQHWNTRMDRIWPYLLFSDGVYYNKKIWCIQYEQNEIYTIDVETAEVEYVTKMVNDYDKQNCFSKLVRYGNEFYLVPWTLNRIQKYNAEINQKEYYNFNGTQVKEERFCETRIYNQYLFFFPRNGRSILRLDMKSRQIIQMQIMSNDANILFARSSICIQEKVYIPCESSNRIFIFDLNTQKYMWKICEEQCRGFLFITEYKDELYLIDKDSNIYKINYEFTDNLQKIYKLNGRYRDIKRYDKKIYMVSEIDNNGYDQIISFDLEKKEIKKYDSAIKKGVVSKEEQNWKLCYSRIILGENKVFGLPRWETALAVIDVNKDEISYKKWKLGNGTIEHLKEEVRKQGKLGKRMDESFIPLDLFLKLFF